MSRLRDSFRIFDHHDNPRIGSSMSGWPSDFPGVIEHV